MVGRKGRKPLKDVEFVDPFGRKDVFHVEGKDPNKHYIFAAEYEIGTYFSQGYKICNDEKLSLDSPDRKELSLDSPDGENIGGRVTRRADAKGLEKHTLMEMPLAEYNKMMTAQTALNNRKEQAQDYKAGLKTAQLA